MNTLLTHPRDYYRMHFHPAIAEDGVPLSASHVRKIVAFAEKAANTALVVIIAYVAIIAFAKFVGAATLAVHCCDLCAVLPVMLVAP